jgi:hypothetical protein
MPRGSFIIEATMRQFRDRRKRVKAIEAVDPTPEVVDVDTENMSLTFRDRSTFRKVVRKLAEEEIELYE